MTTQEEIKIASKYGFREYPHYARFDPINNTKGYYYAHPDFCIIVLKQDKDWLIKQVRNGIRKSCVVNFEDAIKLYLPEKFKNRDLSTK